MTVAARAVHDDRLVSGGLQYRSQAPVIAREVVSREIERAGHMSLLKEDGRARVEDERAFGFDRRTEFRKSDRCRGCDLERRGCNEGCKLGVEPLLGRLIDDRERPRREPVHHESDRQRREWRAAPRRRDRAEPAIRNSSLEAGVRTLPKSFEQISARGFCRLIRLHQATVANDSCENCGPRGARSRYSKRKLVRQP